MDGGGGTAQALKIAFVLATALILLAIQLGHDMQLGISHVVSYRILSYLILSYLILSYLIISYPISSHLISSHLNYVLGPWSGIWRRLHLFMSFGRADASTGRKNCEYSDVC